MATYYDYQKRDANSQIDWSGITKNISDDLRTIGKEREEKKFELEKSHLEDLQKVNEYEAGLDPTANEFALKASQDAKALLLENHKMMKRGIKTVNEAQLYKQKATDNWANLGTAIKGYNQTFKTLSEAGGKGNTAILEDLAKSLDLKDKKYYQNPSTGEGYLATVDENGKIDMKNLQPIRALINQQKQVYDVVDVNKKVADDVKNAAIWKAAVSSTQDIEDVRQNPEFKTWKDNKIKSVLSSDRAVSSVLMDYLNYDYTTDPDDKDPNKVLLQRDSNGVLQPKITPEQKKAAEEAYGNALEIALGRKETKQYIAPRSDSTTKPTEKERAAKTTASAIDDFVLRGDYGALRGKLIQAGAKNIEISDDKNRLTLVGPEGNSIDVDLTLGAKAAGQQLAGVFGVSDAYNQYSQAADQPLNEGVLSTPSENIVSAPMVLKEVSKDTKEDLRNALDPTLAAFNEEGFTPQMFQQQATEVISSAFEEAGLDPNELEVSESGWMTYKGKKVGSIHPRNTAKLTGAQIISFIKSEQQSKPSQKKSVNLNASKRKNK